MSTVSGVDAVRELLVGHRTLVGGTLEVSA